MPQYKVTYFNSRGFAEVCRMLFALADQEYEDIRITREEWPALKPSTPFNQLPMLEVDGFKVSQSTAMYRFLARTFGFTGKTLQDEAMGDMIVECMRDMIQELFPLRNVTDEAKKAEMIAKIRDESLPTQAEKLNNFLGGKDFFLGDSITWVDLVFFTFMPFYKFCGIEFPYDKYPDLKAMNDRVGNNPKIAAWIEKRPVTEM